MLRNNKPASFSAPVVLATGWQRLLLGLSLLLVAAACSSTPGNIGVGLPSADANTGAYLVDTLTVRASTVLRDSIITSSSNLLLVGRYRDPQLGTITAKSYVTMSLPSNFTPSQTQVLDSLVLVLKPNTYRYGDTTKTQTLVDVHRLNSFVPSSQYGYASPKLTPMSSRVRAESVNDPNRVVVRRARPNLSTLRVRLLSTFGQELLDAGKSRQLTSQEQLDARFPGLAILPGATDEAALVQFTANSETAALVLYYHELADPATVLNYSFALSTGRHFYQAEADRSVTAGLGALTTSLQALPSALTTQQTYIQGLLGLQTKIEIPYLTNLRNFGRNIIVTSAVMTAQEPDNTSGIRNNLAPPARLSLYRSNRSNQPVALVQNTRLESDVSASGTPTTFDYRTDVANLAGINQAGYRWSVLEYCKDVINGTVPNEGLLLNTITPATPERVVLGGPNRANNKLQLRLYLISNN
ncbi:DUF4270 domain-containing protein [Hymenobacter setariae]|uniref:DUF4270 domain-containing protein n=1 Tax=Hymenobacter setariae TaxID=2594794 RepID=A0A558C3A3_9BACT|nr:DUF4270 family protein [Hymenobacter setariae]TVT43250.1 DUF4270 domain-containing protein [Hymenobacter setariae]